VNEWKRRLIATIDLYTKKYHRPVPWVYLKALKVEKKDLKKLVRQREIEEVYYATAKGTYYLGFAPLGWNSQIEVARDTNIIQVPKNG